MYGAIAQMGERLPCKQEVSGSIPLGSTKSTHPLDEITQKLVLKQESRCGKITFAAKKGNGSSLKTG